MKTPSVLLVLILTLGWAAEGANWLDTDEQGGLIGSDAGLSIGASADLDADAFCPGLIDEVRIYSRTITP